MAGGDTTRGRLSGEALVAAAFTARRLPVIPYRDLARAPQGIVVVQGMPYTTMYETQGNLDFVVMEQARPAVALEVKHQTVAGSVDEKLCYALCNHFDLHKAPPRAWR